MEKNLAQARRHGFLKKDKHKTKHLCLDKCTNKAFLSKTHNSSIFHINFKKVEKGLLEGNVLYLFYSILYIKDISTPNENGLNVFLKILYMYWDCQCIHFKNHPNSTDIYHRCLNLKVDSLKEYTLLSSGDQRTQKKKLI